VPSVEEGLPIAYQLLDRGVPVISSDGQQVGTVSSVLADTGEDVFHGLLIDTPHNGVRFLEADSVAAIHEHGVDLRIDLAAAQDLPGPEHGAPVYHEDPSEQQKKWSHWVHHITGRGDWKRER
jgi:sporulation protein YlmC with PRC-barrel domain